MIHVGPGTSHYEVINDLIETANMEEYLKVINYINTYLPTSKSPCPWRILCERHIKHSKNVLKVT